MSVPVRATSRIPQVLPQSPTVGASTTRARACGMLRVEAFGSLLGSPLSALMLAPMPPVLRARVPVRSVVGTADCQLGPRQLPYPLGATLSLVRHNTCYCFGGSFPTLRPPGSRASDLLVLRLTPTWESFSASDVVTLATARVSNARSGSRIATVSSMKPVAWAPGASGAS